MIQNTSGPQPTRVDFGNVDQSTYPHLFVQYLEGTREGQQLQAVKQQSYLLLGASEGKHVLDIGCGIGDDVHALAQLVGPQGRAVGIEKSQVMLDACHKWSEGVALPGEFFPGDIHHMDFADATFDGCRAERVFQHCENPMQALAEMVRVVRPGGSVVVTEVDLDSVITHLSNLELARKLTRWRSYGRGQWMARALPGMFHQMGLKDIRVVPLVSTHTVYQPQRGVPRPVPGLLSEEDVAEIKRDLQHLSDLGQFFEFGVHLSVVGYKP